MEKRIIPKFASEQEEADWWYDNREELAKDWVNAIREGRTRRGIGARMRQQTDAADATPSVSSRKAS